jgi:hypothetical protein
VGYVNSVDDFYDQVHVSITPMEFSTGLKIKVAEALSQSKAIMSHKHAFEGFPATHKYHQCLDFEELALAMCELAYDASQLSELAAKSISSYKLVNESINVVLENFHSQVVSKKSVLIILPFDYGKEKKIAHWFAQARIDLFTWNFSGVTLIKLGPPEQARSYDKEIRFLNVEELNSLIKLCGFDIIFNLYEGLPEQVKLEAKSVISETKSPIHDDDKTVYIHYLPQISEVNCLPAIGHITPPFLALSFDMLGDFAWIIGDKKTPSLIAFTDIANGLKTECLNIKYLDDIDTLILKSRVLPKKLLVLKKASNLSLTEQALVDICTRYNVDISYSENFMCFDREVKGNGKQYENEFFRHWQTFINNQHCSQQSSLI